MLDVDIVETSKRGDGIARVKGFVIFVPNTKPGDKVKIRITRVGRSYAVAEVTQGGTESQAGQASQGGEETTEEGEGFEEMSEE